MSNIDLKYKPFINEPKSIVIAPAGHGKTHYIVTCLNISEDNQLILTHTNAGVASIREKIKKVGVKTIYSVETICGFAQKYVEGFTSKENLPKQDSPEYFTFIIRSAIQLFKKKAIQKVIAANYNGIFVDEYQDCTKLQHQLISILSDFLPTHVLGDPMQGIFDFNDEDLVDFETELKDFKCFAVLEKPWRWIESNAALGEDLKSLRYTIQDKRPITLSDFSSFEINIYQEHDLYVYAQEYNSKLRKIIQDEVSLLIIHPVSHNLSARTKLVKIFNNSFYLIEAMDAKDFYSIAKKIDEANNISIYSVIHEISLILFSKGKVEEWLGDKKIKNKRDFKARITMEPLKKVLDNLADNIELKLISEALKLIKGLPGNRCHRSELYHDTIKSIEHAYINNKSVFDSMKNIRDSKRHFGRRITGKCIGTTLLTKGLEFDTVVILNAQKFDCPKNFYVALTRASKRLIIFSDRDVINFN